MAWTQELLDVTGYAGRRVPSTLWSAGAHSQRLAVVFPGFAYPAQAPLLYYARSLLMELGADVLVVDYGYDRLEGFSNLATEEQDQVFHGEVEGALRAALATGRYRDFVLVGKSIGCQAVLHLLCSDPRLADASAVLLTPTFGYPPFWDGLARVRQRCLFVIGTADSHHAPEHVERARSRGSVATIDGADHALDVEGSVDGSMGAVRQALEHVRAFVRPVVR